MHVHTIKMDKKKDKELNFFLCSDPHFDHPDFDRELFHKQMKEARERNCKVIIAGDLFDAIVFSDKKRYTKSRDPFTEDAILQELIQIGLKELEPYADIIYLIGIGNHETSILKYNHFDPISALIHELRKKNPNIIYGGYSGFIRVIAEYLEQGHRNNYTIYYSHGTGGGAEVTKGTIDLSRREYIDANLIWMGHKHVFTFTKMNPLLYVSNQGFIKEKERWGLITGCFINNITQQTKPLNYYRVDWREQKCRTLQNKGGAFLKLRIGSKEIRQELTVV